MTPLSQLLPMQRRVYLGLIRTIAVNDFPQMTAECGLEKAEELILEMISAEIIRLVYDRARDVFYVEPGKTEYK